MIFISSEEGDVGKAEDGFNEACVAIEQATAMREAAITAAFNVLAMHRPIFSQALTANIGDSRKAARWMSLHHRAFDGRNAYQVLAEGDDDSVWEEMERLFDHEARVA